MSSIIKRLLTDNKGATAIEYGLLAIFMAIALIALIASIGQSVSDLLGKADQGMDPDTSQSVG